MRNLAMRIMVAVPAMLAASPVYAAGGAFVLPEPNPVTLVSLGLAGLIIGRRLAVKKPPQD